MTISGKTLIYDNVIYEGYIIYSDGRIWSEYSNSFLTYTFQKGQTEFVTIHNSICNNGKSKQICKNSAIRQNFGDLFGIVNVAKDEEWKNVILDGEKSQYYISNYGRLYAVNQQKMKKYTISKKGYARYRIYLGNEKSKNITAHKLVALYFLDKPEDINKNTINHIDGNKLNNYYKNLEYLTNAENMRHAVENNLRHGITKELENKFIDDYVNNEMLIKDISKKYGFNRNAVSKHIKLKLGEQMTNVHK